MAKHMRLPNGFGQISKLKNRRLRNPYRAMVTVGKTPEGRPICKLLKPRAYFPTYNEAYAALIKHNQDPYDAARDITFKEVFDRWYPSYESTREHNTLRIFHQAEKYLDPVWDVKISEIKPFHIRQCMDLTNSPTFKSRIKMIFNKVLNYAVEYGILDTNVSKNFTPTISERGQSKVIHTVFTEEELKTLWSNLNNPIYRAILIQCYTGFRPEELCQLKKSDVNILNWTITGGMKTEAGRNRIVPIMEKIKEIVKKALNNDCDSFLVNMDGNELKYSYYYKHMKLLFPNHTPHDPRKTFVSMCKNADVDEYAIKLMVGHRIEDLTERVYTERNINWLRKEIEKV